jgi:hypothetical protein
MLKITLKASEEVVVWVDNSQAQTLLQKCLLKKVAKTATVEEANASASTKAEASVKTPIISVWVNNIAKNTSIIACKVPLGKTYKVYVHKSTFTSGKAFKLRKRISEAGVVDLTHWR